MVIIDTDKFERVINGFVGWLFDKNHIAEVRIMSADDIGNMLGFGHSSVERVD